jgi:hypothetical protein
VVGGWVWDSVFTCYTVKGLGKCRSHSFPVLKSIEAFLTFYSEALTILFIFIFYFYICLLFIFIFTFVLNNRSYRQIRGKGGK